MKRRNPIARLVDLAITLLPYVVILGFVAAVIGIRFWSFRQRFPHASTWSFFIN